MAELLRGRAQPSHVLHAGRARAIFKASAAMIQVRRYNDMLYAASPFARGQECKIQEGWRTAGEEEAPVAVLLMRTACRVLLEVRPLQRHRVVPHDSRVAEIRVLDADVLRLIVGAVA